MVDARRTGTRARELDAPWPPTWAWSLSLAAAVIGLGVAAYLTYAHYTDAASLLCVDNGAINCAKVTTSSQSEVFGVFPVAVLGLSYFAVMTVLCTPSLWRDRPRVVAQVRLAGAALGVAMVFYLLYAELFQIDAICLWCTVVHVMTVLLFVVIVAAEASRT